MYNLVFNLLQTHTHTNAQKPKNLQVPKVIQFDSHFVFFADVEILF